MMQLLDIIIPRRVIDSVKVHPKPAVPDTTHQDTAQVISGIDVSGNMQQLADIAPIPSGFGLLLDSMLIILPILVVLFALYLCFNFVRKYRKRT